MHANSYILSFSGNLEVLKDEAITLNGEPAWSLQFIVNSYGSQLSYGSVIYVLKEKALFEIDFTTPPLMVPEMRPVGEKIIQSFQFTNSTDS
jgi:hypothetical protein